MKICHITSAHPRYDGRILFKECCSLSKNGHETYLIVADGLPDEVKNSVKIFSVTKPQSRLDRMWRVTKEIYHKVRELKPDVVHFHDPELMLIGLKLAKNGYQVVYDVHEDLPKQVLNKHWLPTFIRPLVSTSVKQIEKYCASKFAGVVTATPIIAKRFKMYNKNTVAVKNYPILAELNVSDTAWSERQDKLCYIGSISQTRGIIPLIESLQHSKIPLELAGFFSGDINLANLTNLNGGDMINYLGVIDRAGIAKLLQTVKIGMVTLLPTPSYVESLPIKMFEYMLSGIPVVASNFPLWEEIVNQHCCGLLVDPSKPKEIAEACNRLIADQNLSCQMGQNGRNAVLNEFNWEKESLGLIDFYRHLLSSTTK